MTDWLAALPEILELGVNPAFTPTPGQQRIIDRLSLAAEEIRGNALPGEMAASALAGTTDRGIAAGWRLPR